MEDTQYMREISDLIFEIDGIVFRVNFDRTSFVKRKVNIMVKGESLNLPEVIDGYELYRAVFDPAVNGYSVELFNEFDIFTLQKCLKHIVCETMVRSGAIIMHAACVMRKGKLYLFAGPSGVGKTTICGFKRGKIDYVISDDITILKIFNRQIKAMGIPLDLNETIFDFWPVECIFILKQGELKLRRLSPAESFAFILTVEGQDKYRRLNNILDVLERCVSTVPCYELIFPYGYGISEAIDEFERRRAIKR